MEPPIGFILLREAVDRVGQALVGLAWRPLAEIESEIIAVKVKKKTLRRDAYARAKERAKVQAQLQPKVQVNVRAEARAIMQAEAKLKAQLEVIQSPQVEQVIKLIVKQFVAGEILTAYETADGAKPLGCTKWQQPNWRVYFATGEIDLGLPLVKNGRPVADGRTAPQYPRKIFVWQDHLESFVATLPMPNVKRPSKAKAGNKQIRDTVTGYRSSLSANAIPSIKGLEEFARRSGLTGHRQELRKEYHIQFPDKRAGRPPKNAPKNLPK